MQIILAFFAFIQMTFTQEICGAKEVTKFEMRTFLEELAVMNHPASALEAEYEIPIHLVVVKKSNGQYPSGGSTFQDHVAHVIEAIDGANSFLGEAINLKLCNASEITSDNYFGLLINTEFEALYDLYHDPNAVTIYIVDELLASPVQTVAGAATFPWFDYNMIALSGGGVNLHTLAHEMGHFLGLLHTHQNDYRYTPENEWNPLLNPALCDCCDCLPEAFVPDQDICSNCSEPCDCDCTNSGDFICDTPVDPGTDYCSSICEEENCPVTLTISGQSMSFTYQPDKKNLMSYYQGCREYFSLQQLDRMKEVLALYPSREYLRDANVPQCDIFLAACGQIFRVRQDEDGAISLDPLKGVRTKLIDGSNIVCNEISDQNGIYTLSGCNISTGDYYLDVLSEKQGGGDPYLESNGVLTSDLIRLHRHILSLTPLPKPYGWIAADVNNDATITTSDFILIKKLILQLVDQFPNVPTWRFMPEYAFDPQWNFTAGFNADPFTAQWSYDGLSFSYNGVSTNGANYFDPLTLHLLNEDVSFKKTWSFRGIKSGDVNFTAFTQFDSSQDEYNLTAQGSPPHNCLATGETFVLTVKGNNSDIVSGYQLGFSFDPAYIEILAVNQGDLSSFSIDNFGLNDLGAGKIRTLWVDEKMDYDNDSLGTKRLFTIYAKAKRPLCDIDNFFALDTAVLFSAFYAPDGKSEPATVFWEVTPEEIKYFLTNVYPNPSSSDLTFSFDLTEGANVNIIVQDYLGQNVSHNGSYSQGSHSFSFNNISTLQGNLLTYTAVLGNRTYSGSIIKL